jgi:L-carnitine CoA-transferase
MSFSLPKFGNLEGLKVLTTSTAAAGPFTSTLFAENGAEVIFLENADVPDVGRTWAYAWAQEHRNSKTCAINIISPQGRPIFEKMIEWADIFIESSKGGTYEKWGWSDEALWEINPKLIICRISGFGQTGDPGYVNRPSYDFIGQSFSGLTLNNGTPESPAYCRPYASDYHAGLFAAWSCLAAYINLQKTGKGESIDVSQYESSLRLQWWNPLAGFNDGKESVRVAEMDSTIAGDAFYRTKDHKFLTISLIGVGPISRGLKILGLAGDPDFAGVQIVMKAQPYAEKFVQAIRNFCEAHTADEVDRIFAEAQVPCVPAMTYADMMNHPHYKAREDIIDVYVPILDKTIKATANFPKFKNKPGQVFRGGPKFGEHNEEILKNIVGLDDAAIQNLYDQKVIKKVDALSPAQKT